ncbi:MAG: YlbF family regulator [Bacilli bacterium]|nr:YlbF family regulator [Bacilli bacterium]
MKIVYTNGMMKDIYETAYELKDLLSQDERIKRLNELEQKMNSDNEVIALAYQKDIAVSNYSDILNHFSEDSEEVKKAQRELYERKLALDTHPLVRQYLNAYKEVRDLSIQMNALLFDGLNLKLKEHK